MYDFQGRQHGGENGPQRAKLDRGCGDIEGANLSCEEDDALQVSIAREVLIWFTRFDPQLLDTRHDSAKSVANVPIGQVWHEADGVHGTGEGETV